MSGLERELNVKTTHTQQMSEVEEGPTILGMKVQKLPRTGLEPVIVRCLLSLKSRKLYQLSQRGGCHRHCVAGQHM
eukprot:scaffold32461_cov101-Isochrysis_galbana.AAC.3